MARYSNLLNRMIRGNDFTVASFTQGAGTTTTTVNTSANEGSAVITLAVTAVSGTSPTLDVTVQTASDAAFTTPVSVGTFTQATGATTQRKVFSGLDDYVRLSAVVGGSATPTVTWSASGWTKP